MEEGEQEEARRKLYAWKQQQGDLSELNKSGEEEGLQLITLHPAQQPPAWSRTPDMWQTQSQSQQPGQQVLGSRAQRSTTIGKHQFIRSTWSSGVGASAKALCVCPRHVEPEARLCASVLDES